MFGFDGCAGGFRTACAYPSLEIENVFDCLVGNAERVSEFLRCRPLCETLPDRAGLLRGQLGVAPRQLDWMLLMTGLAALVEDRVTLRGRRSWLALTFQVCSAAAVFAVVKRLVDADWGWVAAACWLINPLAFLLAVQATEASVYGASALGLLLVHLRVVEARMAGRQPSWRLVAVYGLALGVLCLARMDGVIVVALAIAALAWPAI